MINPTTQQFRPPLEIQLPDFDARPKLKQDSSTHKTSVFLPNQFGSPKFQDKVSPSFKNLMKIDIDKKICNEQIKLRMNQSPMQSKQDHNTQTSTYATFPTQLATVYKFQTPDQSD